MRFGNIQAAYLLWLVFFLAIFYFWAAGKRRQALERLAEAGLLAEIASTWRRNLMEKVAEVDEHLLEKFCADEELPEAFYEPIEFYPDGRCDPCLIILSGPSEEQLQLEVNGLTGRVKSSTPASVRSRRITSS